METHRLGPRCALCPPDPECQDDLSMLCGGSPNEAVRWLNLQSVGAPPKTAVRRWIAAAYEVHPKRITYLRPNDVGDEWQSFAFGSRANPLVRRLDLLNYDRRFDQRIR